MKKIVMLISLITVVAINQVGVAANDDTPTAQTEETASDRATSTATIGFTTEKPANDSSSTEPTGRLPTTGETLGLGASLLGLLLIIIIFRKDLKKMVLNKKKMKERKK